MLHNDTEAVSNGFLAGNEIVTLLYDMYAAFPKASVCLPRPILQERMTKDVCITRRSCNP